MIVTVGCSLWRSSRSFNNENVRVEHCTGPIARISGLHSKVHRLPLARPPSSPRVDLELFTIGFIMCFYDHVSVPLGFYSITQIGLE